MPSESSPCKRQVGDSRLRCETTGSVVLVQRASTLLCSILLYSTLLYSALLCSALLCSNLYYSTLLYSTILYSIMLNITLLSCAAPSSILLHSPRLYSAPSLRPAPSMTRSLDGDVTEPDVPQSGGGGEEDAAKIRLNVVKSICVSFNCLSRYRPRTESFPSLTLAF